MSSAPDWAQDGPSADNPLGTTPVGGPAAAPVGFTETSTETAPEAASEEVPETAHGNMLAAGEVPFNAALPVAGQPLGASSAYPTPAGNLAQAPSVEAVQQQEDPASNMVQTGDRLSMYQRLSNSSEAQSGRSKTPSVNTQSPHVEDVPSPDDVTIEESGVVGQAAVERILGGVLIEERPLNPSN